MWGGEDEATGRVGVVCTRSVTCEFILNLICLLKCLFTLKLQTRKDVQKPQQFRYWDGHHFLSKCVLQWLKETIKSFLACKKEILKTCNRIRRSFVLVKSALQTSARVTVRHSGTIVLTQHYTNITSSNLQTYFLLLWMYCGLLVLYLHSRITYSHI